MQMEIRVFIFKLLIVDQTSAASGLPTSPLPSELVSQIPEHHVPEEGDGVWYCSGFSGSVQVHIACVKHAC